MKVLIASSSLLAIPLFEKLSESTDHQILGLITNSDKPTGRGQKVEANELAVWGQSFNLDIFKVGSSSEIEHVLNQLKPEIVLTIAFGHLIKKSVLSIPDYGWINIHFSLLPKWKGAAPVQYAILNGESQTGVSIFKLDEGMDTGPIYLIEEVEIDPHETSNQLLSRLSVKGARLAVDALKLIEEGVEPVSQGLDVSSFAPKLKKSDGEVNWQSNSTQIYNQFRALGENPGVWSKLGSERIKFEQLRVSYLPKELKPGQLLIENEKMYAGTKDGAVEILAITPSGRGSMSAAEFVRGLRVKDGLKLG